MPLKLTTCTFNSLILFILYTLQMRMSVRLETLALMPVTMPWAPTIVPVPEASRFQLMAGPVRVHNKYTEPRGNVEIRNYY